MTEGATLKFSDALAAEKAAFKKGPPCTIELIRLRLDKDDRAALDAALASDVPHTFIVRALASVNEKVKAETIARHRRGGCNCG